MGKGLSIYWGAASLLLPFFVRANEFNDVRISKAYLFVSLVMGSIMLFGVGEAPLRVGLALLGLFALSQFNHENFYSAAGIEQTICVGAGILLTWQLLSWKKYLYWDILRPFLAWTCLLTSFVVMLNAFGVNPYGAPTAVPVGPLGQQTLSAALIAITAVAVFNSTFIYALPLVLGALFLCGSAFGWASFIAGIIGMVMMRHPRAEKTLVCVSALLLMLYVGFTFKSGFTNDNGRFRIWEMSISIVQDWPLHRQLLGMGTGHFWDNAIRNHFEGAWARHAHNEFLEAMWAFGLGGLSLLIYIAYFPFRHFARGNHFAFGGLIAALVNCLGNFTFHIAPIALVAIIFYALSMKGEI